MSEWVWAVLAFGGLAVVIWYLLRRKQKAKEARMPIEWRVEQIRKDQRNLRVTPHGLRIWTEPGASCPAAVEQAMTRGMEFTFEKGRCRGYTERMTLGDFNVVILRSTENDSQGFPAYRLPCAQYCGTEYDKGGYILAAGQILFTAGSPIGMWILIPEHTSGQTDHAATIAEYETEHGVLGFNDGAEYERTKTHGSGEGHPIIPSCPGTFAPMKLADAGIGEQLRYGTKGCVILAK